jgi:diguanylate cyclase (GGDEF)-like protein
VNVTTNVMTTWWTARPQWLRFVLILSVYFISSFASVLATNQVGADILIALIYPSAGLNLVLLLVFGLRYWPALFVNPYIGGLLAELFGQLHLPLSSFELFGYAIIQVLGFGGGVWLMKRLRFDARLIRAKDTTLFILIGSFLSSLVVSVLTIGLFTLSHNVDLMTDDFILNTLNFFAGDATGAVMVGPLLLVLLRPWLPRTKQLVVVKRPLTRVVVLERIAQFLLLAATVYLGYARESVGLLNYSYAIFMPLAWIALRGGFVLSAWAALVLNLLVTLAINFNLTDPEVVALQFNLMVASYAVLLLGAVSSDLLYKREKLSHVAYHDALTGLLNRAGFLKFLEGAKDKSLAVFFLDLDRFKIINDSFGQTVGDAFLLLVSRRLKSVLPEGATLARFGADEFAVCLEGVNETAATTLAKTMNETLATPNRIQGYDITTDASIGVAFHSKGYQVSDLIRDAESAMQEAKRQGKARFVLFDTVLQQQLKEKLRLERDLRQALERGEIFVYYQPIVSALTGEIVGAEALMRWKHGQLGFVSPAAFIPIAEDTGLIVELSNALFKQALADMKQFPASFYLSANLSVRQLQYPGLEATIIEFLNHAHVEAQRLVLEVTESSLMVNPDANIKTLERLSQLGLRLAMDDFGTGYASLNYLKRLPVDILKIDRSFISGLPADDDDATLVTTILALGQSLGLAIVAEGVETKEQEMFLKRYGCQQVQGYLYSKPVPLTEFVGLLGNGKKLQG